MQRLRYNHSLLSAGLIAAAFLFNISSASADPRQSIYMSLVKGQNISCAIPDEDKRNLISYIESDCLNKASDGNYTAKNYCTGKMSGSPAANLVQLTRRYCDQANAIKQANGGASVTPEQRKSLVQNLKENKKEVKAAAEQIDKAFDLNIKKSATDAVKSGIDSVKDRASSLVAGADSQTPQSGNAKILDNNIAVPIKKAIDTTNTQAGSAKSENVDPYAPVLSGKSMQQIKSDQQTQIEDVDYDKPGQARDHAVKTAKNAEPSAINAAANMPQATVNQVADVMGPAGSISPSADALKTAESKIDPKTAADSGYVGKISNLSQNAISEANEIEAVALANVNAARTAAAAPGAGAAAATELAEAESHLAQVQAANQAAATAITQLNSQANTYSLVQKTCSASHSGADHLCSFVTNEKVIAVQGLMAVVTPIITKSSSARESCEILEKTNKVGQFGMAAANLMCLTAKSTCDVSCPAGTKQITTMMDLAKTIMRAAPKAGIAMESTMASEQKPLIEYTGKCKAFSLSSKSMLAAAATLATSSKSAENCKEKLTAGGGGASGMAAGAIVTTAEHCSKPENANSSVCRCTQNPNADGCFGSFAGVKGVATQNKNSGSGMASNSGSSSGVTAAGPLSNEQKQALGFNTQDKNKNASTDSMMAGGLANVNGVGSSSDGSGSGLVDENGQNIKTDTTKKSSLSSFSFGSLSGGLGSFFGSNKGGKNAAALKVLDPQKAKEQELAIKRKLASEQLRSEVSMASGKSNFDKIRNRYQMSTSSLFNGQ